MNNYKNKYLKYKLKYNQIKIYGGSLNDRQIDNDITLDLHFINKRSNCKQPIINCDPTIGFNNMFGTCWLVSLLYIYFFSNSTSNCVQTNIYNVITPETHQYKLLLKYFSEIAKNPVLFEFMNNIKKQFNNKKDSILHKSESYNKLQSQLIHGTHYDESGRITENRKVLFDKLYMETEEDLGKLSFKFMDKQTNNNKYGGSLLLSFIISNILSCLLLNKLTKYKIITINLSPLNYLDIKKSIGMILYMKKINGNDTDHNCSFIECNNTKIFTNNHRMIPYRWDLLLEKYNNLYLQNNKCKLLYFYNNNDGLILNTDGPVLITDTHIYYFNENNIRETFINEEFITIINSNIHYDIDNIVLIQQIKKKQFLIHKDNFINMVSYYIYYNNSNKLKKILTLCPNENINYFNNRINQIKYPLYDACNKNYYNIVKVLLTYNTIDVNINYMDMIPLLCVCSYGYNDILNLLLNISNINIDITDSNNDNALMISILNNNDLCIDSLLPKININHINHTNNNDNTPLYLAYELKNYICVNKLLSYNDIDINKQYNGNTILNIACNENKIDIVKKLLEHPNIDVNLQNFVNYTPLNSACIKENDVIVELLLQHPNIDVNLPNLDNESPLINATLNSYTNIISLLIKHPKININIRDNTDDTPLLIACKNDNLDIILLLLQQPKIDVNISDIDQDSPLYIACSKNNLEMVEMLLLNTNININCINKFNNTPLHIACTKGYDDIVEILVKYSIDYEIRNNTNNTPLMLIHSKCKKKIKEEKKNKIISLLLNNGAIDTRNEVDTNKCKKK